jgi:SAM-dependent methyltransferase
MTELIRDFVEPSQICKHSEVELEDFACSFGTTIDDISRCCSDLIAECDFKYTVLDRPRRDSVILDVLRKIETDQQVIGAPKRKETWERGWAENLKDFVEAGCDLDALIPKFIRPGRPIRLNRDYIVPNDPMFELNYYRVFRRWLFMKYLGDFDFIYEFGCGTGFNLVELAKLYPEKKLYGLDFVPSSVDLVNKFADVYKWNITGHLFDMIRPDHDFKIANNGAVFTVGAVEQLAGKFEPFLEFLLKQTPRLCIHVEPTVELYDQSNLVDYLATKFHRKRGYTEGYLPRLKQLERDGKIEILKVRRPFFGGLYMEGYSLIIWKPKRED